MENFAVEKDFNLFPASQHWFISLFLLILALSFALFSYISTVMLKFRTDKGRDPGPLSFAEDSQLLKQIRDDVLGAMGVSSDLLSDCFVRYKASSFVLWLWFYTLDISLGWDWELMHPYEQMRLSNIWKKICSRSTIFYRLSINF